MDSAGVKEMLDKLESGWSLNSKGHLEKLYKFKNFARALAFVNQIGAVAEEENHHPDIYLAWGQCRIEIWTHVIGGLAASDFYLAAKADREYLSIQSGIA
jgi:4a-hydroxytetrahydrobiopterin dehydratase